MKNFDNLRMKSAVKSRSNVDLSFSHLTTANFGEALPLLAIELNPSDHASVKGDYFSRQAPMPVPTYGRLSFRTASIFVPYYQVCQDFDSFASAKTLSQGVSTASRFIPMGTFADWLINNLNHDSVSPATGSYCSNDGYFRDNNTDAITGTYDWSWIDSSGTTHYITFRPTLKFHIKILNCLGYALPSNVDLRTSSQWYTKIRTYNLSALPLLAFAKAYNDYMSPSQLYNTSSLTYLLRCAKDDKTYASGYDSTTHSLTRGGIDLILRNIVVCYENDYFTSAWQFAHQPITSSNIQSTVNVENQGYVEYTAPYGAEYRETSSGAIYGFSQLASNMLRAWSNFVRRNLYTGTRPMASMFSRFGIKPEDYRYTYSHLLNYSKDPIQVGDVTATAQSTGVPLGDYAGKGIMQSDNSFEYKSSDFGMLFVIGWYTVTPFNSFGFSRHTLRNTALDYFQPEFDGVGPQAIPACELFVNPFNPSDTTMNDLTTFGFTERYNDLRFGRDMITGEFRDYHSESPMNAWHTGRLLAPLRYAGTMVAQNPAIVAQPQIDSEFNRIFSITDASEDKFYLTCRFHVRANRPMNSLNHVPDLPEGNLLVPRNGNVIS